MKLSFHINFHTIWGQKLCIIGSIPELGEWETAMAKDMNYAGEGNWQLSIDIETDNETRALEYRYFLRVNDRQIFEEWENNHRLTLHKDTHTYTLRDYWQTRPANITLYSSAFTKSIFAHPIRECQRALESAKKLKIKISAPQIKTNQSLAITGNQRCLGNWKPEEALILDSHSFPEWQIDLDAEAISYPLEYKFLVLDTASRRLEYWEPEGNRLLSLPPQERGETVCVSGLFFRDNLTPFRAAGTVVPVFSLRSENSFGVGDLGDLKLFIDWIRKTGQQIIQVLPMNDTTVTHTWTDSYPYSAISIYALHPIYISLTRMGDIKDRDKASFFAAKQNELNQLGEIDYPSVMTYKVAYCRAFFEQEGRQWLETEAFTLFFSQNREWLIPYAAFSYLRDTCKTAQSAQWGIYAVYDEERIQELCSKEGEAWPEISFTFFLQFVLHTQFREVSAYARENGIILKGDLPIGVNRDSVEVWVEPQYFNLNGQAGAPPDDFSAQGQNWFFPTYNWDRMEEDRFKWWKKRFDKLSDYFDALRIDHILGFFRIWEIPMEYTEGLCGHFNPALPLSQEEIEQYGLAFDEIRFTTPRIHREHLDKIFGQCAAEVAGTYLEQSGEHHLVLKPFCNTQAKIDKLFAGQPGDSSQEKKRGLLTIASEQLFLRHPYRKDLFHPRISASQSYIYNELNNADRYAFDHLYWDFFYRRHNDFWKKQAYRSLTPLVASTSMLVCGEDLGMIPDSVPEVMNKLQILSLEIGRISKAPGREFADFRHTPYLSVCTTSTHDMPPLRSWWREDPVRGERYCDYASASRPSPEAGIKSDCTAQAASIIIKSHLDAPSMMAIIPLQDWLALSDTLKREDCEAERINVPSDAIHYWRYRMHITIEKLLSADELSQDIMSLLILSRRTTACCRLR
ncbi:MAG: 4-alpha-glucanotransferase [Tannerellaceae bacterium]|jgi:4-alpha-glucanotransferase|nr:4-alpha-glucanotransferase [Tannerellaceae bacterium]